MRELSHGEFFGTIHGSDAVAFSGIEGFDPRTLEGEIVRIDGVKYRVLRIQTFCIFDPTGFPFSLIVERHPYA